MAMISERWTRVRTLGRGASGAEVFLAADDVNSELFAVKSACASGAAALRREQAIMSALRSPRVVSCIGGRGGRDGSYQLFIEFAPGGSLADEIARTGGIEERNVRAYAADVAAGLAYLHRVGTVHGDVKARNVVIGADGRAKLADFGCASTFPTCTKIIGGTPAFMAPEVAREEEQGPAADVWALGCTVVEMATGRAPWSGMDGDALAAMHRIGYTDAVPEVPQWLSVEAKDFLGMCFVRRASDRCTAAQLLEHPFLASAVFDTKLEGKWVSPKSTLDAAQLLEHPFLASAVFDTKLEGKWVSPKSTLDAAFWESESDSEEADEELSQRQSTADRIKVLACPASALPDWDSDEGWIDVFSGPAEEVSDSDVVAVSVEEMICLDDAITTSEEPSGAEPGVVGIAAEYSSDSSILNAGAADDDSVWPHSSHQSLELSVCQELVACTKLFCNRSINAIDFIPAQTPCLARFICIFAHYSSFWRISLLLVDTSLLPLPLFATRSVSKRTDLRLYSGVLSPHAPRALSLLGGSSVAQAA